MARQDRLAVDGGDPVRPPERRIVFHRPWVGVEEEARCTGALRALRLVGNGPEGKRFQERLRALLGGWHVFFTPSCTAAFEMALMGLDLPPGAEVVCPAFTYPSMTNAIVNAGLTLRMIDVDPGTFMIDPTLLPAACNARTRAVVVVHYAGMGARMDEVNAFARVRGLVVIEDAAQGIGAAYRGRPLGTLGDLGCISFHATKNLTTGEGGALCVPIEHLARRFEILHEKGTDRAAFLRGEVDKYTWVDRGGSFVQSDLLAALGLAQMDRLGEINRRRQGVARRYLDSLRDLEAPGAFALPRVPEGTTEPNWHIFALRVDTARRDRFVKALKAEGIDASTHYEPLHLSPFARSRLGTGPGLLPVTEEICGTLVRLPIWPQMTDEDALDVVRAVRKVHVGLA
ncbi:MAG: aminotransferase class V-fold PLP-dependent enzyme [Planctomycetes bacterium]|nr:aminotransferase class V-fold PLP-dependent enzyme [Planctomycetota bacterium]